MYRNGLKVALGAVLLLALGGAYVWVTHRKPAPVYSMRHLEASGVLVPTKDFPRERSPYDGHVVVGVNKGTYYDFTVLPTVCVIQYPPVEDAQFPALETMLSFHIPRKSEPAAKDANEKKSSPQWPGGSPGSPGAGGGKPGRPDDGSPRLRFFMGSDLPVSSIFMPPEEFLKNYGPAIEVIHVKATAQCISANAKALLKASTQKFCVMTDEDGKPISGLF